MFYKLWLGFAAFFLEVPKFFPNQYLTWHFTPPAGHSRTSQPLMRPLRDMLRDGTAPGAALWGRGGVGDALLSEVGAPRVVAIRNWGKTWGCWKLGVPKFQIPGLKCDLMNLACWQIPLFGDSRRMILDDPQVGLFSGYLKDGTLSLGRGWWFQIPGRSIVNPTGFCHSWLKSLGTPNRDGWDWSCNFTCGWIWNFDPHLSSS